MENFKRTYISLLILSSFYTPVLYAMEGEENAAELSSAPRMGVKPGSHYLEAKISEEEAAATIQTAWKKFKVKLQEKKIQAQQSNQDTTKLYYDSLDKDGQKVRNIYYYHTNQKSPYHYCIPEVKDQIEIEIETKLQGGQKKIYSYDDNFLCFTYKDDTKHIKYKSKNFDDLIVLQEDALIIPLFLEHEGKKMVVSRKHGENLLHHAHKNIKIPLKYFKSAAKALKKMHKHGIGHGDVKPENFVCKATQDEDQKSIKYSDVKFIDVDGRIEKKFPEDLTWTNEWWMSEAWLPENYNIIILLRSQDNLQLLDTYAFLWSMILTTTHDTDFIWYFNDKNNHEIINNCENKEKLKRVEKKLQVWMDKNIKLDADKKIIYEFLRYDLFIEITSPIVVADIIDFENDDNDVSYENIDPNITFDWLPVYPSTTESCSDSGSDLSVYNATPDT